MQCFLITLPKGRFTLKSSGPITEPTQELMFVFREHSLFTSTNWTLADKYDSNMVILTPTVCSDLCSKVLWLAGVTVHCQRPEEHHPEVLPLY